MQRNRSCPLCGGENIEKKYGDAPLPIWRCSCGMVFLMPHPSKEELKAIYGRDYYESWGVSRQDEEAPRAMKRLTFAARLNRMAAHTNKGRVLDVGCATGFFLEVAEAHGWEAYGVELSQFAAALAQEKFGNRVINGTLDEARFDDAMFDCITLSDLIEHVPDPFPFLYEVRRVLKPAGVLLIVTPNVASLSARFMGSKWSHYKAEHLHYFSPATIRQLLDKCGFTPVAIEPAPKYLNLSYIINQFRTYRHPLITPLLQGLDIALPERIKRVNFPIYCGEMLVLALNTQ